MKHVYSIILIALVVDHVVHLYLFNSEILPKNLNVIFETVTQEEL